MAQTTSFNPNILTPVEEVFFGVYTKTTGFVHGVLAISKKWTGIVGLVLFTIAMSPLLLAGYFLTSWLFKRIEKELSTHKEQLSASINNLSIKEIKEEEEGLVDILNHVAFVAEKFRSSDVTNSISRRVNSIELTLKDLVQLTQKQYKFSKDEFFDTNEDFSAFQDAFSELNDIWSYETTDDEHQFVMETKRNAKK